MRFDPSAVCSQARLRAVLLCGAMALAPAAPAFAGEIAGSVSDVSGTVALQAAQVRIIELNRSAVTERDGAYVFADVPAGDYTLEFSYVGAPARRETGAMAG